MAETPENTEELDPNAAPAVEDPANPDAPADTTVETPAEEETSGEDILGMSDEDFEKQNEEFMAQDTDGIVVVDEDKGDVDPEALAPEDAAAAAETSETADAKPTTEEPAKTEAAKPAETPAKEAVAGDAKASDIIDPEKSKAEAPTGAHTDPLKVDDGAAAAAYRKMFTPFKANGKMVQPRTPEEAITLMQMGANYAKSMKRIKPAMTMVKTLSNNGINTADDLNFLVELKNGNSDAIKKLVRDAGINPLDITVDDESRAADEKYRPKDYSASETQVDLEMTLADVGSHPEGRELLESVQKDWDVQSRESIASDPGILHALNEHKTAGIYDQIDAQIKHEQMLGNLKGVPYLQAYQQVGDVMTRNKMFKEPAEPAPTPTTETKSTIVPKAEPTVIERKAAVPKSTLTQDARARAASSVKNGAVAKALPANPLAMSDEDFEKLEGVSGLI